MAKIKRPPVGKSKGLPDKDSLRDYLVSCETPVGKRDIARHYGLKGQERVALKALLRELVDEGSIEKTLSKTYRARENLPPTLLAEIDEIDLDGEIIARPVDWQGKGQAPKIYVITSKRAGLDVAVGDKVLLRVKKRGNGDYEGSLMKTQAAATGAVTGILRLTRSSATVSPADKSIKEDYTIPPEYLKGAQNDDLVVIEEIPPTRAYPRHKKPARIVEVLGNRYDPRLITLIAIHAHGIPNVFPEKAKQEAKEALAPTLDGREDLRDLPLVTIDGIDARDYDDAVYACADQDPKNPGGWKIVVAIADVSSYVTPGSALDQEAFERGNSTYFADRVVPMLPEELSNDLCSLMPGVDRACVAAHMRIDKNGALKDYRFARALMRSHARLTYEQVEQAYKGEGDAKTVPLIELVIKPLYGAYKVLDQAREKRGALDLDVPERKVIIDEKGDIAGVATRERLDSHKLIEEFMILANVAAASQLEEKHAPCLYRIHERPAPDRLEATAAFLKELNYSVPRGEAVKPANLNVVLREAEKRDESQLINTLILRTQSVAAYSPDNIGHFGLALQKYAHFSSPIRRYADLIVHRSLVRACRLGEHGLTDVESASLNDIAEHICFTERRSMMAERDTVNRFSALYLSRKIGSEFKGRISSVTHFGLFVMLDDTGADGIVPMRNLPRDYYIHDEKHHALIGRSSGRSYRLAQQVVVRLLEADPIRGSTVFEIVDGDAPVGTKAGGKDRRDYRQRSKSPRAKKPRGKKTHRRG